MNFDLKRPLQPNQSENVRKLSRVAQQEKKCMLAPSTSSAITSLPFIDLHVEEVLRSKTELKTIVKCSRIDHSHRKNVILRGFWSQLPLRIPGEKLRLFSLTAFEDVDSVVDGTMQSFIITYPDTLVQCTAVAGAVYCKRRVVLNEIFRGGCDPGNKIMIIGSVVHCLFQAAVQKPHLATKEWLANQAYKLLYSQTSLIEQLWAMDFTLDDFMRECSAYFENIISWCKRYYIERTALSHDIESVLNMAHITGIRDIEENIWCSKFGLRGKVDLCLTTDKQAVVPVELKTGKASCGPDHQAQLLLYTIMLSSFTTGALSEDGLLVYLKMNKTSTVRRIASTIQGVLQLRNELAHYFSILDIEDLPVPTESENCKSCPQLINCALVDEQLLMRDSVLSHLRNIDHQFYKEQLQNHVQIWRNEKNRKPKNANTWLIDEDSRQEMGECYSKMQIINVDELPDSTLAAPAFTAEFAKFDKSLLPQTVAIGLDDMLIISNTSLQHYSQFMGTVIRKSESTITISLDRKPRTELLNDLFRLDIYTSFTTMTLFATNLTRLMFPDKFSERLRRLIIDHTIVPTFGGVASTMIKKVKSTLRIYFDVSLTDARRRLLTRALVRTMSAQHFALISAQESFYQTILSILSTCLQSAGYSVLLVTHSALRLDEILSYIIKKQSTNVNDILRLGSTRRCNADQSVHHLLLKEKLQLIDPHCYYDGIANIFQSTKLVGCTYSTVSNHLLFGRRRFDYVIADVTASPPLMHILGALLTADKFVLMTKSDWTCELFDRLARLNANAHVDVE